jgi:hypothetical protein
MSSATSTWSFYGSTSASTTIGYFIMPMKSDISQTITSLLWDFCWEDSKGHIDLYPTEKSLPNGMPRGKLKDPNKFKPKTTLGKLGYFDNRSFCRGFQGFHGTFRSG